MIGLNLSGIDVELDGGVTKRYDYDSNNNRTDTQARDEFGYPLWSVPISMYHGAQKEGSYRVIIHSIAEPILDFSERHPLVTLKDPQVRIWQSTTGNRCTIHCQGVESLKKDIEGVKK